MYCNRYCATKYIKRYEIYIKLPKWSQPFNHSLLKDHLTSHMHSSFYLDLQNSPLAITYNCLLEQPCNPTMISIAIKIDMMCSFSKAEEQEGAWMVLSLIFLWYHISGANFNVMDSMWSDGRFPRVRCKGEESERSADPL